MFVRGAGLSWLLPDGASVSSRGDSDSAAQSGAAAGVRVGIQTQTCACGLVQQCGTDSNVSQMITTSLGETPSPSGDRRVKNREPAKRDAKDPLAEVPPVQSCEAVPVLGTDGTGK